jgi:ribose transport system permease protein
MNAMSNPASSPVLERVRFQLPLTREFLTVLASTIALIIVCRLFAPSSIAYGALTGSLPFTAILVIVGLGQMLVVQQGGFDLSVAGGVSATAPSSCPRSLSPSFARSWRAC